MKARKRGRPQLGTLGSGNHFLEIQVVEEIFDEEKAKQFGLFKGQITIMIHCGSRGAGHQICTDHLEVIEPGGEKVQYRDSGQAACLRAVEALRGGALLWRDGLRRELRLGQPAYHCPLDARGL